VVVNLWLIDNSEMVTVEIQQVRYFLALCDELNFTRAAMRCRVAQPSLTNAIKRLEKDLGGQLFHRTPRTRLSELGRLVRPHLRQIIMSVARARQIATVYTACSAKKQKVRGRRYARQAGRGHEPPLLSSSARGRG
jgi:DNA-binding transcriptional LysR family regulator